MREEHLNLKVPSPVLQPGSTFPTLALQALRTVSGPTCFSCFLMFYTHRCFSDISLKIAYGKFPQTFLSPLSRLQADFSKMY